MRTAYVSDWFDLLNGLNCSFGLIGFDVGFIDLNCLICLDGLNCSFCLNGLLI